MSGGSTEGNKQTEYLHRNVLGNTVTIPTQHDWKRRGATTRSNGTNIYNLASSDKKEKGLRVNNFRSRQHTHLQTIGLQGQTIVKVIVDIGAPPLAHAI